MLEKINDNTFSFKETQNKVVIFWKNIQVMILKDAKSEEFLNKISNKNEDQVQLELAKITGNFKRGNEKKL